MFVTVLQFHILCLSRDFNLIALNKSVHNRDGCGYTSGNKVRE